MLTYLVNPVPHSPTDNRETGKYHFDPDVGYGM